MKAVYQKEIKSYFYTPTGWLFISVFLGIASLIFYLNNIQQKSSDFTPFLSMMSYVWMLLTPILVMRLLSGERRMKTDLLLKSSPLLISSIVLGKYLAACTVLLIAVALSFLYPLLIAMYARVFLMEIITGYLGFVMQGCAFIALDLMVTSGLSNTVSAAAVSFGVNLFVWLISLLPQSATIPKFVSEPIAFFSLYNRFVPFINAQFSPANTLFYLVFCGCALLVSMLVLQTERARRR